MKFVMFTEQGEHLVKLFFGFFPQIVGLLELNLANGQLLFSLVKLLLRLHQFTPFRDNLNRLFVIVLLMNEN